MKKVISKSLGVLTAVLSVAALVLYFFHFGKVSFAGGDSVMKAGTEFAFGADYNGVETAKSSNLLFTMILTAFTVLFAALSIKFKKTRWATLGFSIVAAVYMLVIALSSPFKFIDLQGYDHASKVEYVNMMPLIIAIALFLTFICGAAYLLLEDSISAAGSKDQLTVPKKISKFFRDYIGEIKKIVWPGPKAVIKNTVVVLIVCAVVGLFIWLIDFGLSSLLNLIYN